jgi:hypothetical protein
VNPFHASVPPAPVRLARDARTTLVIPAVLVAIGAALGIGAVRLASGPALVVMAGVGLVAAIVGVVLALRVGSLRLAVATDYLHLTGMGIDRRYNLIPGDLKRVASSGLGRVAIRPGTAALAFAVGQAPLGAREKVDVIRLGATPSVVLVPTEQGRVALAAAVERELVEALMAAAAARARASRSSVPLLTAAAVPTATVIDAPAVGMTATVAPMAVPPPRPVEPPPPPRPMTGIERMALEEQMAEERRAAFSGAQREQAMASFSATAALSPPSSPAPTYAPATYPPAAPVVPATPPLADAPAAIPTPVSAAALPAIAATTAAPVVATTVPRPASTRSFPLAVPRGLPRRRPLRPMAWRASRPTLAREIALLAVPLILAGVVWFMAALVGATAEGQGLDPLSFALLLSGPIAALAIFLARTRWPRLAGLSSLAAVLSLALVARAVIG